MLARQLIFVSLLTLFADARAQTMYVTDQLRITLRTGPSTDNAIIANLETGDEVEVLEADSDAGYSRVRIANSGNSGWVLSRYLRADPAAADELARLRTELDTAQRRAAELETALAEQRTSAGDLRTALDDAKSVNHEISGELADIREASGNVVAMQEQIESLRRRNNELAEVVETQNIQISALASRSRQNWFVVGAIVLAAGMLIGLIAPHTRRRRRTKW
jgi:SH3 domain protein